MKRLLASGVKPWTPLLFVMPAFIIYTTFIVYPMVDSFIVSLQKWDGVSPKELLSG